MMLRNKKIIKNPFAENENVEMSEPVSLVNNFKQGDVVFGLSKERSQVTNELVKKNFTFTVANDLNVPTVRAVVDANMSTETLKTLAPEVRNHFKLLNKHRDYLIRPEGKPIRNDYLDPIVSSAYRRACKLLLINRDRKRHYRAHVVTKNIIWKKVCNKLSKPGVTDSEMRAAYRDAKENGPNRHILFYDANNKLMKNPPWEIPEFVKHWKRYDFLRKKRS